MPIAKNHNNKTFQKPKSIKSIIKINCSNLNFFLKTNNLEYSITYRKVLKYNLYRKYDWSIIMKTMHMKSNKIIYNINIQF